MLNDSFVPVRSLRPLAVMLPQSFLTTSKCQNLSPKLITELLLWGHEVRLHTGRQIFRDFGGCGRKRPCVPGWGHHEGTGDWPVLTSPSLPLMFFLHCVNVCEKSGLGLRTLIKKHPLFWLSPPAAVFYSLDRRILVCAS